MIERVAKGWWGKNEKTPVLFECDDTIRGIRLCDK
jgi:hypothetical protein